MTTTSNLTIGDRIEMFLEGTKGGVATLKELYTALSDKNQESVRAAIYMDKKNRFEKVSKGIYMLKGKDTASLLIKGNSRNLTEIEDESIDCIITDHPWKDLKAQKSGNKTEFANYDKFNYTQEDFNNKARVLKDGCFLAEFIPLESATNYEYLYQIKQMAKEAGLNYYAKILWKKSENDRNCGRMTKECEEIMIFYKGKKPRSLNLNKKAVYRTTLMLPLINTYYAAKGKSKNHQSEKPIELYEFLIEMLTVENEVVLDQFGGSCNLLQAAINKNRFSIVYEIFDKFVQNAVNRFKCITLFESKVIDDTYIQDTTQDICEELKKDEAPEIETIPLNVTNFQLKVLNNIKSNKNNLLSSSDLETISLANDDTVSYVHDINNIFNNTVKLYYNNYFVPQFNLDLNNYVHLNTMYSELENIFNNKFKNKYVKNYYLRYKIESRAFIEYCICIERIFDFQNIKHNLENLTFKYANYIQQNYKNINPDTTLKILNDFLN